MAARAFGPRKGRGPHAAQANTGAMQLHLDEINRNVTAKAHAVVLMDCAGWQKTDAETAQKPHHYPAAVALAGAQPG